jgi:hypothetical protein
VTSCPQNFALNAVEAQIVDAMTEEDGSSSDIGTKLDFVDTAFTIVFTLELVVNAYAYWFRCALRFTPADSGAPAGSGQCLLVLGRLLFMAQEPASPRLLDYIY